MWARRRPEQLKPFRQRWPWIGPDLQTLRDTLRPQDIWSDFGESLLIRLPDSGALLVKRDLPLESDLRGWVLLVHGLAGSSERPGVRRLAMLLFQAGFGVWRLNLRGAGAGRPLAAGTYAAACNSDLLPVLGAAREQARGLPLLGVGLSLGGTVLLNALLEKPDSLDGLACVSSPLDLDACSRQIARPRNSLYQRYLVRGLIRQTLADPYEIALETKIALNRVGSIREFDSLITAPRWGYADVNTYYREASPLGRIISGSPMPPMLLIHALDDPWVPVTCAELLAGKQLAGMEVCLPQSGGHNGFHDQSDSSLSSWADRLVTNWLAQRCG